MSVDAKATDVAERLRVLQTKHKLTIQEMAERCGLPKRSLENYMNLKSPQRPGLDALIGIADGFDVSIDWLVGRSDPAETGEFGREDYAIFCQSTVVHLLVKVLSAVKADPEQAIDPEHGTIMGYEVHEVAAAAMFDFMRQVELQSTHPARPRGYFKRSFESWSRMAVEEGLPTSADDLGQRKP
ncbi:helix-turn-helix transcriptional regulator [Paracoccus sp. SSJ]|uniref:helix-turn-helix domain-containing protein n=1 Tax=Paracoccus sp. SSJ TaxID=3050636 RepID=UPI00254A6717|nr:helix-turn-helix transcriptional regulator [Paracoccus sp. SSJ]MDK8873930.1 helix-turn-helix transcriptional regulator [Paracoccus sp. SSJ]